MKYRREIDGLRALAIIPVILFHAGFELFSGGFVGVDIFFVISGYLITTVILSGYMAGNFSLIDFYERRARRILPAIFVVMATCLPFAWFWLLPDDVERFSKSLIATPLYISNILFFKESGYFDTAAELKPLLHTWSLSLEEQFYIIFPLLVGALWRFCNRKIMCTTLFIIGVISLITAHIMVHDAPEASFFLLHTRAWELLIGSAAAIYFLNSEHKLPNLTIRQALSVSGLLLILIAIFYYDKTTPFPSLYALVPTIGSLFIILYAQPDTWVGRVLGTKIAVGLGLISYSAYLWHQPLFAFARHRSLEELNVSQVISLCLFTIILSYFSWKYIEQPFRQKRFLTRKKIFGFSLLASLTFILIGIVGIETDGFKFRFSNNNIAEISLENSTLRSHCDQNKDISEGSIDFCILGDTSSRNTPHIAVFGDSHSEAMLPLFDKVAKSKNISFTHIGLGGCPPLLGVDIYKGNYPRDTCRSLAQKQYDYVLKNKIKTVFLIARWSLYTSGTYNKRMKKHFLVQDEGDHLTQEKSQENFISSINETLSAYTDLGVKIYILLQTPQQKVNPLYLYARLEKNNFLNTSNALLEIKKYSIPLQEHKNLQSFNREVLLENADKYKNVNIINPDQYLCKDNICFIGSIERPYYKDNDHINTYGSDNITKGIEDFIF